MKELKDSNTKPSLDDMAFEGRNKLYGAYLLRKTYQARLFRSFLYSLIFFLSMLLFFAWYSHRSADNTLFDLREVGVDFSNNPATLVAFQSAGGAASPSALVPDKIVADEEVPVIPQDTKSDAQGKGDSTAVSEAGAGETGKGNSAQDANGVNGEVYGSADVNPQFPGGDKARQAFIKENLENSAIVRSMNIRGTILIYVVVAADGSLKDVKVTKGLHPDLDAEALRVVNSMPRWQPAMRKGIPVNVRCYIPISVSPIK